MPVDDIVPEVVEVVVGVLVVGVLVVVVVVVVAVVVAGVVPVPTVTALVPVTPFTLAAMVTTPFLSPVTLPDWDTEATVVSLDDQCTFVDEVMVFPEASNSIALSLRLALTATDAGLGVMVTFAMEVTRDAATLTEDTSGPVGAPSAPEHPAATSKNMGNATFRNTACIVNALNRDAVR